MKKFIFFLGLIFSVFVLQAQDRYSDSLKKLLADAKNEDTSRILALSSVADYYGFRQFDSCLFYASQVSALSQKLNYTYGKFLGYRSTFFALNCQGNYPKALEAALNIKKIAEELKTKLPWVNALAAYFIGTLNREMGDFPNAVNQLQQAIAIQVNAKEPLPEIFFAFAQLGILYGSQGQPDSALWYAQRSYELGMQSKKFKKFFSLSISTLGNTHMARQDYKKAGELFRYGILQSRVFDNIYFQAKNYNNLANLYSITGIEDSAIYYAGISLQLCRQHNFWEYTFDASEILTRVYDLKKQPDSALKYMKIMLAAKDSVFSQTKGQQFQQFAYKEIQRLQKIDADKEQRENLLRTYFLITALVIFLLLAVFLYRNNRQKQKAKLKIENAYIELKSTQAQLIQSEKMASLGELTAGIAHEIQNPLNFVNNFSELSSELIDEMVDEVKKGNTTEAETIANDIKQNLEKINHHGKRADAIVKGMLQHSRSSSGQKELTDINKLADEYLRLAYHGLRAKDKSFNAILKTDYDESIGTINIIPQDIGRVILNLITNAFYAVAEKKKQNPNNYEPTVIVKTSQTHHSPNTSGQAGRREVIISVADNGNGIPQNIIDKIFQPFFTTKPTGQGTGLGLSLAYDIIKAHAGELKVETKDREETTFIMKLPVA